MTAEVWTDAACTTTLGRSVPRTASTWSSSRRSQACPTKVAGRAKITARAADAVASHASRSRFRPAITTRTGSRRGRRKVEDDTGGERPGPEHHNRLRTHDAPCRIGRAFLTRRTPLIGYVDDHSMAIGGSLISPRPAPPGGAADG